MPNLTAIQKVELGRQAKVELSKRSYRDYIKYVHHGMYEHFRHTDLICESLQPIAEGQSKKIMIFLPPRHGKSMTVTESFPSYFIGRNPNKRVITTAYGDSLARKFGRMNKQKVQEFGYPLFEVELSYDNASNNNWSLEGYRGGMISTGIGGAITGEGADLLIIDDPFKNREEANSKTIRDKVWDEWQNTLLTRLHKGASVILIMTRWHQDDIAGRLLDQEAEDWEIINLPALAEGEHDLLNRKRDEPLCPELGFDEEWAVQKQKEVGSLVWAALYQQRPSPAGGGIFKRSHFRYFIEKDGFFILLDEEGNRQQWRMDSCRWFQTIDTAMKKTQGSDFTAIGTFILTPDKNLLIYDIYRDRLEVPDQWPLIKQYRQKWSRIAYQAVEDKASGIGLIQQARREGRPLKVLKADVDKVTRAFHISVMYENGMVYHKQNASWLGQMEEELLQFPNGANDDVVDICSYAGMETSKDEVQIFV